MNTEILAVALATLLVAAGGAVAVGSTVASDPEQPDTHDADVEATYDGANATVTVANGDEPVQDATGEVGDGECTTDADGTVTAPVDAEVVLQEESSSTTSKRRTKTRPMTRTTPRRPTKTGAVANATARTGRNVD